LKRIDAIKEEDIDYSDCPPLDDSFFERTPIELPILKRKESVTLRLDSEILEWFKKQGKGYQTKINAILKSYFNAHHRSA
jgi:uncharacterized protein (DUF4415 family)